MDAFINIQLMHPFGAYFNISRQKKPEVKTYQTYTTVRGRGQILRERGPNFCFREGGSNKLSRKGGEFIFPGRG